MMMMMMMMIHRRHLFLLLLLGAIILLNHLDDAQEEEKEEETVVTRSSNDRVSEEDKYNPTCNDETTTTTIQQQQQQEIESQPIEKEDDNHHSSSSSSSSSISSSCGLYLAPSTIPGAGLGVFAGNTAFLPGDGLAPDVQIPILELSFHIRQGHHHHHHANNDNNNNNKNFFFFWPLTDYYWSGDIMGMSQEANSHDIEAFCPGIDAVVNSHSVLNNTGRSLGQYDSSLLLVQQQHENNNVGAGAFTRYHNGSTPVTAPIPVGGEIFKYYGDHWFHSRTRTMGYIPLPEDYATVERLIRQYMAITSHLSQEARDELWSSLVRKIWFPSSPRFMNALPDSHDLSSLVVGEERDGKLLRAIHQPKAIRSIVDELDSNMGRCVDNIIPKQSSIPQAGRGAYARRFLSKNSIISASPLVAILNRDHLIMYAARRHQYYYHQHTTRGQQQSQHQNYQTPRLRLLQNTTSKPIGHQLLLNYCMGHNESSLLLCPYGVYINYINHNQTLANVKIQWAPHLEMNHNDTYLTLPVRALADNYKTKLAVDYVALRDIEEGEELFLDYGNEWEEAWQRHVAERNLRSNDDDADADAAPLYYTDSQTFNQHFGDFYLRTVEEQKMDPYPTNLELRCHENLLLQQQQQLQQQQEQQSSFWEMIDFEWKLNHKGLPCTILERQFVVDDSSNNTTTVVYNVQLARDGMDRKGVPRKAISFVDRYYSTDTYLENAFRHDIRIPDDMFPDTWKNRRRRQVVVEEEKEDDEDKVGSNNKTTLDGDTVTTTNNDTHSDKPGG